MEHTDHGGGMNIGDVVLHPAEPLDVLAQGFPFLLGNDMQITGLAMSLVAYCKGANELMAQILPGRNGIHRQVHQPRHHIGLERQREIVGKHLVVASPSSLHHDGVDAEELGRMGLASVLLADVGLERAVGRPLELPQLMGKGRAAHLVR